MSRESAYYDDQSKGGGMGRKLAEIAAVGAGGAGLMAGPIKLASLTGQKELERRDAKKREADAEIKRETRGVPKPANFDTIEEAKQDAKDAADRKKISDMGYKKGGSVSSASKRADGCCTKGKTRGKMV